MNTQKNSRAAMLILLLFLTFSWEGLSLGHAIASTQPDLLVDEKEDNGGDSGDGLADPLEPVNRAIFTFNDRLYFWVLKPVKTGYAAVVPKDIRGCLDNFVNNLATPVVLLNTLLQGRWSDAGGVLARFGVNTVLGVYGFADPAASEFDLRPRSADFGQTLGVYGAGEGIYLVWPVFGPSNIRDTVGLVADNLAQPINYLDLDSASRSSYSGGSYLNKLSLAPEVYEDMKKYSLDPYVSAREAYHDYRKARIETQNQHDQPVPTGAGLLPDIENKL